MGKKTKMKNCSDNYLGRTILISLLLFKSKFVQSPYDLSSIALVGIVRTVIDRWQELRISI